MVKIGIVKKPHKLEVSHKNQGLIIVKNHRPEKRSVVLFKTLISFINCGCFQFWLHFIFDYTFIFLNNAKLQAKCDVVYGVWKRYKEV